MKREAIATGNTTDQAKENACKMLNVDPLDERIEFEILEMQSKKVLGIFGGRPAKVKITLKQEPDQIAEEFLSEIIKLMGLEDITLSSTKENDVINIDVEGEDVGFIIGRRGETLDALQYLACLVTNRVDSSYSRVCINTGDYREKREKTLENLGRRLAIKVAKTGKKCALEPMNPYERRIIHTSVQKINGAISYSEGENLSRHVVIAPDPNSKRNYSKGGRKPYKKNSSGRPKKQTIDADRKPINEGSDVALYGRIDK